MAHRARKALALASLLATTATASAQDALPLKPDRKLDYEVSSGTYMSLAVSPDGKTILFDMLGELYALPSKGGRAVPIATGMAFEVQPTFSPDGKWIAYVSDRTGGDNVWIARADGSGARRITEDDDGAVRTSPEWSADGKSVYVSRHRIRLDRYELWRHPIDGGKGKLVVPIRQKPDAPRTAWQSTLGVSPSHDGKWLYFARRTGDLSFEDPVPWTVVRRNVATGAEETVIDNTGGREAAGEAYFRPVISPDGKQLAYATRRMAQTTLRVRNLTTGVDRDLGPAPLDLMNGAAWIDLIPRYSFTPDSKAILIAYNGKIERRPIDGSPLTRIPFKARLQLAVAPSTRIRFREDTGSVRAKMLQGTSPSPDGERVAYAAFGSIYVQPVDGSAALRLPVNGDPASMPSWSPDGRRITYVTWSEATGGAVWTVPSDGTSTPVRVNDLSAYYTHPVFTPDGKTILTLRSSAAARQQSSYLIGSIRAAQLVEIPTQGGNARVIASGQFGQRPHFVAGQPGTTYLMNDNGLIAVDLASGALRAVANVKSDGYYFTEAPRTSDAIRISPDGKWIAAQAVQQLYVLPVPADTRAVINLSAPDGPARRVTDIGADFFEWRADKSLIWTTGNWLQTLPDTSAPVPKTHVELIAELPRARPAGSILLRGARALTMANGDKVIDDADILITADRIAAIGPRGSIPVPQGTPVRELGGKTVTPGFIDDHDHIGTIRRNVISSEDWSLRARLAFGVTTSFDPSTLGIDQIAYQDLLDAGLMIGPRLRSTGPALFSREHFQSLDEVRAVLRRYREAWGLRNIKQYRAESRTVRQWIAMASSELGLLPTTEGSHNPKLILTQLLDGYAGNEHALPIAPFQEDVIKLIAQMRTSYVATLLVNTSGPAAKHYYVAKHDPALDPKVRRFWSPYVIASKLGQREWASMAASRSPVLAADVAKLAEAGALVGMGSHGDDPGVGFHYEMEAHVDGGMPIAAVLHAATAGAAETIGRLDDMGTLEVGKYADLIVFDHDPLADIRNTLSVKQVMRGGQLFDADTLDELWPTERKLPPAWYAERHVDQWPPVDEQSHVELPR
ncbi:amidohydrolase family protein [Novosphingobium aquae]|uniref:Amidohydrolase family protein n=1 Tax=Novosphingobium aquae TaxID=3133435 RepID=A0ABU8SBQ2_9SPHN